MLVQTTDSGKKTCIVCGADVAGKPRVKDAKGRYICAGAGGAGGDCQAKLAEQIKAQAANKGPSRPAAPPVVSVDDKSILNSLIESSPMLKARTCEQCGSVMPGDGVICTRCGFNTTTGKNLKTAVIVEREKKEPKPKKGAYRNRYATSDGPGFWKFMLIYSAALSLVSLLIFAGPAGVLLAIILLGLANLAAWVSCTIMAFKNDQTIWGVCGLLHIVPFINIVGVIGFFIFNLLFNEDNASRAMYWATFIGSAVFIVMLGIALALGVNVDLGSSTLNPFGGR